MPGSLAGMVGSHGPRRLELMAITNDPATGATWHRAGVDRLMIDLETFGKAERQHARDTVKSDHLVGDISDMRAAVPGGHIVVRLEPVAMPGWRTHVDAVLEAGPDAVMLPMVRSTSDAASLVDAVADTAELIVMIETAAALDDVDDIMAAAPGATFFVGLNDLHIELGHHFMFEPLARGHVDAVGEAANRAGVRFGFGGLARPGRGLVDAADVVREHVRLGSTLAILARSFFGALDDPEDVAEIETEIRTLRHVEELARGRTPAQAADDHRSIVEAIDHVAVQMAARS